MTSVLATPEALEARMSAIRTCIERSRGVNPQLTITLALAHEALRWRSIASTPVRTVEPSRFDASRWPEGRAERIEVYDELIDRIRRSVGSIVPSGSRFAVVSRGDERLLDVTGIRGGHFPQGRDGRYAGFYPPDGDAAVAHLLELVGGGTQYLVLPATAYWWLDHYRELAHFLRPLAIHTDEDCTVFDLRPAETPRGAAT